MLGKNNLKEKLHKMEVQAKRDRFSIRKLSVGAASVLLGFTFLGLNSQSVKADSTVTSPSTKGAAGTSSDNGNTVVIKPKAAATAEEASSTNAASTAAMNEAPASQSAPSSRKDSNKPKKAVKLSTYSGLKTFLKKGAADSVAQSPDKQPSTVDSNSKEDAADSSTIKPNQPNSTTTSDSPSDNGAADVDKVVEPAPVDTNQKDTITSDKKPAKIKPLSANVKQVTNWKEFTTALSDATVDEVDVMADLVADSGYDFKGRKVLIKSGDGVQHKITLGNHRSKPTGSGVDMTFENLHITGTDIYGMVDTSGVSKSKVTIRDCWFEGSQMFYGGANTSIIFEGTNVAETIHTSSDVQQLFEFTSNNSSIEFHGKFTGKTISGNVIQMSGNNDKVTIAKDADVTLQPGANLTGNYNPGIEGTAGARYAIALLNGSGQSVEVQGKLNIDTVNPEGGYQGGASDNKSAAALYLNSANANFKIENGASVNIKTNGDIPSYAGANNLVYIGGNFYIRPNGSLNITGSDMGTYAGTLVQVAGTADIENGGFGIELKDEGATGAGTGNITLVDVPGKILVNNPTYLTLDAHLNKGASTSVIGKNAVTTTNVRQELTLDLGNGQTTSIDLPPFDKMTVQKNNDGTISASELVLLDGKKKLTKEQLEQLQSNPNAMAMLAKFPKLGAQLPNLVGQDFDTIFKGIIKLAFSDPDAPGYNNIHFVPAIDKGFLDIDPENVQVVVNDDGSRTIKGVVSNYNPAKDGPASDSIFQLLVPGGTKAYVSAKYVTSNIDAPKSGQMWQNPSVTDLPYGNTNDDSLPSKFAAVVNDDGTFEFTIPADEIGQLEKGDAIELTPTANFISYNPLESRRPVVAELGIVTVDDSKDAAAKAINDAIADAKSKKPVGLTPDQSKAFDEALDKAAAIAANPGKPDESVYGADSIKEVNARKNKALGIIANALTDAENNGKLEAAKAIAQDKIKSEAQKQAASYPSLADKINAARDAALNTIAGAHDTQNLEDLTNQGIASVDKVAQDYKQGIKDDINGKLDDLENKIDAAASDANLKQAEKDSITALKNDLQTAKNIAKDGGRIDNENKEGSESDSPSVVADQKEALDNINKIKAKIDAIIKLETTAQDQIQKHKDDQDTIQDELNKGVDNILNGTDPDGSAATDAINNAHGDKEKAQAAKSIKTSADAARERVQNSGLTNAKQKAYLDEINQAEKSATAKPGDSDYDAAKSIYGTSDDQEIKDRLNQAQNLFSKAAAKAEVEGYAKDFIDSLGLTDNAAIVQAVKDGLDAINQIDDATSPASDNSTVISNAEKTAKSNILAAARDEVKSQIKTDAENAKNIVGSTSSEIDEAVAAINKLVDSHTTPADLKQDLNNGKTNILNAYKTAAKNSLAAIAQADKEALGVTDAKEIDNEVKAAGNLINQATSIEAISTDLSTGKDNVLAAFKEAAKKLVQDNATKAKESLGVATDTDIDAAATAAINAIDQHTATKDIKQDIIDGQAGILTVYKNKATAALKNKQSKVNDAIDKLANISDDAKTNLKGKVDSAYENAEKTVNDAKTVIIDQIDQAKNDGITKMDDVLTEAQGLDQAIVADQEKVNNAAKAAIDQVKGSDMSDAAKQKAITDISAAAKTAKDNVGKQTTIPAADQAAKDGITAITNAGSGAAQADLDEAKTNNQAAVDQAAKEAKERIEAAYDKLTPEEQAQEKADHDAAVNAIENAAKTAKNAISKAKDKKAVTEAAKQATGAIDVAETGTEVAFEKVAAKDAIKAEADRIKAELTKPEDQKKVDDLVAKADQDIDAAGTVNDVDQVRDNAISDIDNVKTTADTAAETELKEAKNKAITELQLEQSKVKGTIDGLANVSADVKQALKDKVDNAYKDAANDVAKATSTNDVDTAKTTGIKNIDAVLTEAKDIDAAISKNKQKLDDAAQTAIDRVNGSDMTDAEKSKAIDNIKEARDDAKKAVGQQDTIAKVEAAEQDGEAAITNVENSAAQADLDEAKTNSQAAVDQAAKEAKERLEAAYDKLTPKEQAQEKADHDAAVAAIESAAKTAKDAISKAKDKKAVTEAAKQATGAIDAAETGAEVAFEKVAAKNAIKAEADKIKAGLTKPEDQKKVDDLVTQANQDIDSAGTVNEVDQIKNNAISDIDNVKTTADAAHAQEVADAKQKAIDALDKELDGNGTAGVPGVINSIEGLSKAGLTPENIEKYQYAAQNAHDEAVAKIEAADDVTTITATQNDGLAGIDKALADAQAQAGQDKAASDLQNAQKEAANKLEEEHKRVNDAIDKLTNISADARQALKDKVNSTYKDATDNVAKASTPADVDTAQNNGITKMDEVLTEAQGLDQAIATDQQEVKDAAQAAIDRINQSDMSDADKQKAITDIEDAAKTAAENVGKQTTVPAADQAVKEGIVAITGAETAANQMDLQEAQEANKAAVDAAAKAAKERLDDAYNKLTETEKAAAKADYDKASKAIDAAVEDAKIAIDQAQDKAAVASAAKAGAAKIGDAVADAEVAFEKVAAKDAIKAEADKIKADLTPEDQKKVDDLVAKANQDIDSAGTVTDVDQVKNNAISDIDNVKTAADDAHAQEVADAKQKAIDALDKELDGNGTAGIPGVINSIEGLDKAGLTPENIEKYQYAAQKAHDDAVAKIKAADDAAAITAIQKDGLAGIDQALEDAKLQAAKDKASKMIEDKFKEAAAKLHDVFGDKADINNIVEKAKAKISGGTIAEIENFELEFERELATAAIEDAAANAKAKLDKDVAKHNDGSSYTAKEKAAIKAKIDQSVKEQQEQLAKAQSRDQITSNRDHAIDLINDSTVDHTVVIHDGNGGSNVAIVTDDKDKKPSAPDNKPAEPVKVKNIVLMHNAYLYDETGKRANEVTLKAGSSLVTYGLEIINGRQFYVLVDKGANNVLVDKGANNKKYYVATGNAQSTVQKLDHNAYIYNKYGKRVKGSRVLQKGTSINTYGATVKIRGHRYYIIAKNGFVKAANVLPIAAGARAEMAEPLSTTVNEETVAVTPKKIMHGAYLYNDKGDRANGLVIAEGSTVDTIGKKQVNGREYYVLADGMNIAAGNIDGKKLKLQHNAYIYSQYGNRLGKQVLKKHSLLTTYGDAITIKGQKYYLIAQNKYVKKANFR